MKGTNSNPLMHALLPITIVIAYLLIGFIFPRGWAIGWVLFFLIPIVESLITAAKKKNATLFAYPVFVTAIFLFIGMMWHIWSPTWIMFITIPIYYILTELINKSKKLSDESEQEAEYQANPQLQQNGTYYQPTVEVENKPKSNNSTTAIIITVIVCISVVAIVAIICTFSLLSGSFNPQLPSKNSGTISDDINLKTDGIRNLEIYWISGKVDVDYYDGDTIMISESASGSRKPLIYYISDETLHIEEYDDENISLKNIGKKDLTLKLPKSFDVNFLDVEVVSASVDIDELNAGRLEVETVSGNVDIDFAVQPSFIDVESVSGNTSIELPKELTGYTISVETVSGNFNNDGNFSEGDGLTKIEFESVSGDLTLERTE